MSASTADGHILYLVLTSNFKIRTFVILQKKLMEKTTNTAVTVTLNPDGFIKLGGSYKYGTYVDASEAMQYTVGIVSEYSDVGTAP